MTGYDITMEEMATLYGRDPGVTLAFDVYQCQIIKYISEGIAAPRRA